VFLCCFSNTLFPCFSQLVLTLAQFCFSFVNFLNLFLLEQVVRVLEQLCCFLGYKSPAYSTSRCTQKITRVATLSYSMWVEFLTASAVFLICSFSQAPPPSSSIVEGHIAGCPTKLFQGGNLLTNGHETC